MGAKLQISKHYSPYKSQVNFFKLLLKLHKTTFGLFEILSF